MPDNPPSKASSRRQARRDERSAPRRLSLRARLLGRLAGWSYHHPWLLILIGVALAALSIAAASAWLQFETSRDDLISADEPYVKTYKAYLAEFGDRDDLVIVAESDDLQKSKSFARALAARLESDSGAAREVFYRIDPDAFHGKALLYLSAAELRDLRAKLQQHTGLVEQLAAEPSLEALLRFINREISSALVGHIVSGFLGVSPDDERDSDTQLDLTLLTVLAQSIRKAASGQSYDPVWQSFLRPENEMDADGYLVDDSHRFVFILVVAPDDTTAMTGAAAAIERVRRHIRAVTPRYPGIRVGITGGPALATEEMQASVRDTSLASIVALLGVAACFILFYHDVARPLLAVFTLLLGLAWSFGFITFTVGHLTILSVSFATILIGMSDDFGVHLISRFEEETAHGHSIEAALRRTFIHSGGGIIAGAVTFAIAFFAMTLTNFLGMAELGIIGAGGILLCLVGMLTVFPATLVLYEHFKAYWLGRWVDRYLRLPPRLASWEPHVIDRLYRHPHLLLAGAAAMTVLGLFALPRLQLDLDLLRLQASGTESVEWEREILRNAKRSSWYAVSITSTIEKARALEKSYNALPQVGRVESIASVIPGDQQRRLQAIAALQPVVEALPAVPSPRQDVDVDEVVDLLRSIRFKLQQDEDDRWDQSRKPSDDALRQARSELAALEPLLNEGDPLGTRARLAQLQRDLLLDFKEQLEFLHKNTAAEPITLEDLPQPLRQRFISPNTGRFLVQIFPADNIWQPEALRQFVGALRRIDPDVTGGPISFLETSQLMRDGYIDAGIYALIAICLLVFFDFRDLGLTLLALVPLAVGCVWTAGIMWLAGLQFNLANLIILPLIVGIGISNGIHIIHRHIEDGSHEMSVIARSTGKAVVVSSLTTMVGFGALMVAQHRGIFSLGLLLTIGIGCNLLASITVLPSLLSYLPHKPE